LAILAIPVKLGLVVELAKPAKPAKSVILVQLVQLGFPVEMELMVF
jgi:hypothetical protein